MADNQETPDVSARDISELLGRFDATLAEFGKRLDGIEAQASSNGEQLSSVGGRLDVQRDALVQVHTMATEIRDAVRPDPELDRDPRSAAGMLAEVLEHVREAAPLLQSRAAKAIRAGGSVIDYLKAGRS